MLAAPAGFGKTTLLTDWLATLPPGAPSVAWLSLDRRDNDPSLFWTYVVTAMRTAVDGLGSDALQLLSSSSPSTEAALAALLNDLGGRPEDLLLILDDYHLIEAPDVHEGMTFLLEHRPPQLHVVLATRTDPPLPLARMRARGQLVEVRAADLRFTVEESAAYLNGPMELRLSEGDLAALDGRTEGWIAALQLAALSMQGRDDVSAFIAGFAGDDRYVVDYLGEEVLARQSAAVREFLLRTSILERLTGPLCDAVTGRDGGKATLVALERANLFVVPLDDRRQWYRYHHLFADVLHAHLLDEHAGGGAPSCTGGRVSGSRPTATAPRRSTTRWPAVTSRRAADLMELADTDDGPGTPGGRARPLGAAPCPTRWCGTGPCSPSLFAGALTLVSDLDTVGERLSDVERSVRAEDGTWPVQPPPISSSSTRTGTGPFRPASRCTGPRWRSRSADLDGTVTHARQAMSLAPPDDHLSRASGGALAGLASWTTGDLAGAHAAYTESIAGLEKAGFIADVLGCCITLGDIRRTQGRLTDALHTYQRALTSRPPERRPSRCGGRRTCTSGSRACCSSATTSSAARRTPAPSAMASGTTTGCRRTRTGGGSPWPGSREAEGDLDAALELLDEADRVYVGDYLPNVRPVPAVRARLRLRRGELDEAEAWARERHLSPDDELSYLHEYEHVTLARLLLARHRRDRDSAALEAALGLLDRLLAAAQDGGRAGALIEVLILRALAHQARGDLPAALAGLQRAVTLAAARGLRAALRRRGAADGGPAEGADEAVRRPGLRPAPAGGDDQDRAAPRPARGARRAAERPRARRAAAARHRPRRA